MAAMDHHFPSSPTRPPKHVVYMRSSDSNAVRAIHGFCTAGITHGFIIEVMKHLPKEKPVWESDTRMRVGGIAFDCSTLEEVMESTPIQVPYPYTSMAAEAAGGSPIPFSGNEAIAAPSEDAGERRRKRKKDRRSDAETPAERPQRKRTGGNSVSANDIAEELGLSGSKVRSILRDANYSKPYQWDNEDDIEKVRQLIRSKK